MRLQVTPELICELNRIAIQGVRHSAGKLREVPITITNTSHIPPPYEDVHRHMNVMCDYVNHCWNEPGESVQKAIHVAAYVMWRLNWIHPLQRWKWENITRSFLSRSGRGLGARVDWKPYNRGSDSRCKDSLLSLHLTRQMQPGKRLGRCRGDGIVDRRTAHSPTFIRFRVTNEIS